MAVESAQQNFLLKPPAGLDVISFDDEDDLDEEGYPEGYWETIGTAAW